MRRFAVSVVVAASLGAVVLVLAYAEEQADEPRRATHPTQPRRDTRPGGAWEHGRAPLPRDAGTAVADASDDGCVRVPVIGTDGQPSPQARVSVENWTEDELDPHPSWTIVHRTELYADGEGIVRICAPAGWVRLDARDDRGGWARYVRRWPPTRRAVIRLLEPMLVQGTVRDERGAPIPGAELQLAQLRSWWGSNPAPRRDTAGTHRLTGEPVWRSDAEGRFAIPVGRQALVEASVFANGFLPAVRSPLAVRLGETTEVSFTLRNAGSICGTVRSEGEPIADVAVGVRGGAEARTDEAGRFCLDGVDPDELNPVWVAAPGWITQHLELGVGEHDLELQRSARLRIRARVPETAARCTRPRHADLSISISPVDELRTRSLHTRVDVPVVLDLEPERVDVALGFHGYGARRTLSLRAGVTTEIELMLSLEPDTAVLELLADDADGPRDVVLEGELERAGMIQRDRLTDGHRCFVVPPGRYRIRFEDALDAGTPVVLGPAQHARVVLTPPRREAPPPPSAPPERCRLPLAVLRVGDEVWVADAYPDRTSLRPGDRLVRIGGVEGDPEALVAAVWTAGASTVPLLATRPDGSIVHDVVRSTCD
jgi:hypothetical protein